MINWHQGSKGGPPELQGFSKPLPEDRCGCTPSELGALTLAAKYWLSVLQAHRMRRCAARLVLHPSFFSDSGNR
jgi:hypothetical protein